MEQTTHYTIYTEAGDGLNGTSYTTLALAVEAIRTKYGVDCHQSIVTNLITNDAGDHIADIVFSATGELEGKL